MNDLDDRIRSLRGRIADAAWRSDEPKAIRHAVALLFADVGGFLDAVETELRRLREHARHRPMGPCRGCEYCTKYGGWTCLDCDADYRTNPDHNADSCPNCGGKVAPTSLARRSQGETPH